MISVVDNKINPFPRVDKDKFSLDVEWYLPQHLELLKKITNNPNLRWDFSTKSKAEQAMYQKIYKKPYFGNLGLLFYREPNHYWAHMLPAVWYKHKFLQRIDDEEMKDWEKQLLLFEEVQKEHLRRMQNT